MDGLEPVRRTREIEDWSNLAVVHPVSNRLVPLCARLGITPNAVSLAGMACGLLAGVAYRHYRLVPCAVGGFALMLGWHVLDGVDGQLARLMRRQSAFGKLLDGICDYVTFTSVYLGLGLAIGREHGAWIWAVVVSSGLCHAVQSAIYERQRQDYLLCAFGRAAPAAEAAGPVRGLLRLYGGVQAIGGGGGGGRCPLADDAARLRFRAAFAPFLRHWSVLSANYRTLAIFLFAVAGIPLGFFCWEIAGLGAILGGLLWRRRVLWRRFEGGDARAR